VGNVWFRPGLVSPAASEGRNYGSLGSEEPGFEGLTFAIGDVHGYATHLDRLLERIESYAGSQGYRLVFLGDLINRGPQSAAVVKRVRDLQDARLGRVICLRAITSRCC
jgi:serine/threonine protein phosphatase 1